MLIRGACSTPSAAHTGVTDFAVESPTVSELFLGAIGGDTAAVDGADEPIPAGAPR